MPRQYLPFDDTWGMQVELPVSLAVRTGGNVWTCGQCDLDANGRPRHAGDLAAQTPVVMAHLLRALADAGAAPGSPLFVHACYVTGGEVDEHAWREQILACLPPGTDAVLALTPLAALGYPGMRTEIDAVAADAVPAPPTAVAGGRTRLLDACRLGSLVYTADIDAPGSGGTAASLLAQLGRALQTCGSGLEHVVKLHLGHADTLSPASVDEAETALADGLVAGGVTVLPVFTRVPLPRLPARGGLRLQATALAGDAAAEPRRLVTAAEAGWSRAGAADWPQALAVAGRVFLGMQLPLDDAGAVLHEGDMAAQTRLVMDRTSALLEGFGASCQALAKMHTWYVGDARADDLHATLTVRAGYFCRPSCPSTGLPLPALLPAGALVAVDGVAVLEDDA